MLDATGNFAVGASVAVDVNPDPVASAWTVLGSIGALDAVGKVVRFTMPAGVALPGDGNYDVRLSEGPGPINATFNDTGGPLEVSGTLAVNAARAYFLDGLIKPRADAPQELVDGLNVIASEPDAEGRRRLMLNGSL